jgi:hypothetical protein
MWHEDNQQAPLIRAPAQHDVLAQPPLFTQGFLQRLEIATLYNAYRIQVAVEDAVL